MSLLERVRYVLVRAYALIGSNMGLDVRKPVFRVSDKARLKPDSSATETS